MSKPISIYTKLAAAREQISVEKKSAKGLKYKIYGGDEVLVAVGDALASVGVWFVPNQEEITQTTINTGSADNPRIVESVLIRFRCLFVDIETGDTLEVTTSGTSRDYGDKALFQAQTMGIKTLFIRMFLLGDGNSAEERKTPPPQTEPRAPAAPKPDIDEALARPWTLERVRNMLTYARGEIWTPAGMDGGEGAHGYNRLAVALEVSTPGGKPQQLVNILNREKPDMDGPQAVEKLIVYVQEWKAKQEAE